jgi:hypothetical protein
MARIWRLGMTVGWSGQNDHVYGISLGITDFGMKKEAAV